mmetsp:Transcript_29229/g.80110  ORF Transcript_29229/g.80110 Transcript_29229/m.80110 type:complete len:168 (-) Transcript_29229:157-660(-)|eukprot:CAMPEP_0117557332 /NCGR_PEP_ID=MMETSP0784-20121206/52273_1 /TAXON_ID=39447 /ORGANISM="" /LENGTH=167 /DNA_ID=CAMNT_0005354641 /DNA_START=38 /DNA_END=541 /DNA_ORIENTATION=+
MDETPASAPSAGGEPATAGLARRARPLEQTPAAQRASPGDTIKEELSTLMRGGRLDARAETQDGSPRRGRGSGRQVAVPEAGENVWDSSEEPDDEPNALDRGRARGKNVRPAERRAAPGDTLREELAQMRLGKDAVATVDRMPTPRAAVARDVSSGLASEPQPPLTD